jgi:hypothetical protein
MTVQAANPAMAHLHPVDHPCLLRGDELSFPDVHSQAKGATFPTAARQCFILRHWPRARAVG